MLRIYLVIERKVSPTYDFFCKTNGPTGYKLIDVISVFFFWLFMSEFYNQFIRIKYKKGKFILLSIWLTESSVNYCTIEYSAAFFLV